MIYLNAKEIASKWGVTVQTVLKYCKNGSIADAYKHGKAWYIPENAQPPIRRDKQTKKSFTYIDLFCGIGGFHQAMRSLGGTCVFACDINAQCRDIYTTKCYPKI